MNNIETDELIGLGFADLESTSTNSEEMPSWAISSVLLATADGKLPTTKSMHWKISSWPFAITRKPWKHLVARVRSGGLA
ncbi:MAG: hypothetical protein HN696_04095 [Euryarchaeota archaeon]|nr:hypothetical protein [Euryarchaeota archaeon]